MIEKSLERQSRLIRELTDQNKQLSLMVNLADVGLVVTDCEGNEIFMANTAFRKILSSEQPEEQDMKGQRLKDILGQTFYETYSPEMLPGKDGGELSVLEYYWEELGKWLQIMVRFITWTDGRSAIAAAVTDITWIRKRKDEYKEIALYDSKLELPNGVKLEWDIKKARSLEKVSLICLDIDNLRTVNDVYGWEIGDALLFEIRDWLLELQVPNSRLYRVDSDEFGILADRTDPGEADRIAACIRARFDRPWELRPDGQPILPIYCAVTLAVVHGGQIFNNRSMINLAERILRDTAGQGKVTTFDARLNREFNRSAVMQQKLASCVRQGMEGFEVYYQPITNPRTGIWCGVEALCRWECPGLGWISPAAFIPEAERLGLIGKIGEWVLKMSVCQCKQWRLDRCGEFILDVNVSPLQIRDKFLADSVLETLEDYGYPGHKLSLEITESAELHFDPLSLGILSALIRAGVTVALDDFGTGYSSFHSLKNMPAGILKTEKAFIDNIEEDYYAQQLFRVMVELAHVAGKKLIAEGVETDGQRELLASHNVDFLQGYLFSKPLPPRELEKELHRFYAAG